MTQDYTDSGSIQRTFVQTAQAALPELDQWSQITKAEVDMVADMTRRNELSGGTPVVRDFEQRWAAWIGSRFAVTVMNGTSALYSAYFGLGVGPGDEVICPVNTWICTIAPAMLLGAKPVFCDVDPESLLIDPDDARRRITPNTRCIVPVHLWGNVCDMDAALALGREQGIPILEDCSHAHGAKYKGRMCGSLGAAGCWSFQGSKPISAGEGGILTTDDVDLFERACLVGQVNRIAGIDLVGAKYAELQPLGLGMKFRAHPLGIGIASAQLDKLEELNRRRGAYIAEVEAGLKDIPGLRPCRVYDGAERGGFYGFPVLHDPDVMGKSTEAFVAAAAALGLNLGRKRYPNLHELPLFQKGFDLFTRNRGPLCPENGYTGYKPGDFPKAELAAERALFLPELSDPVANAAGVILETLQTAAG
ncbi:MAG TPA: DegT/DnrJ/EryC1/StrS family aminotransferase [Candidatus Hydrogenedentes bacterium]|nr:DegT/DnrJ/EryC1/StrS family aminotransferase [Candidatus Hydrogenedentota bacterium]